MKKNVGKIDKIIRVILALFAFYLAYSVVSDSPWNYVLYGLGAILIVTSLTGSCLLYIPFGVNTCEKKDGK